jgi:hypothetical protein
LHRAFFSAESCVTGCWSSVLMRAQPYFMRPFSDRLTGLATL